MFIYSDWTKQKSIERVRKKWESKQQKTGQIQKMNKKSSADENRKS